jgi:hypothetical protein
MMNGTSWSGSFGFAAAPLIAQAELPVAGPTPDSIFLIGLWMVIAGFALVATQRRLRAEKRDD